MRYLLMSCSADKTSAPNPIPALERYNGPAFKTLRRYLRHKPEARTDLAVGIISAKYGLVFPETLIPAYDQRMEEDLAAAMQPTIVNQLKAWIEDGWAPPKEGRVEPGSEPAPQFFYMLGKEYQPAVVPEHLWLPSEMLVFRAEGGFISQRTQLLNWLERRSILLQPRRADRPLRIIGLNENADAPGMTRLQGIRLRLSPNEIEAKVKEWLTDPVASQGATRTRYWTATVGPYVVAPKWLVSHLSGLPVSQFAAADARRVLQRLGIPMQEHSDNPFLSPSTGIVSQI